MAGFFDKVQKAVFNIAEGIGRTFEKGAALPGRATAATRSGLGAALKSVRGLNAGQMLANLGSRAQSGVFSFGQALGNPRQTLSSAIGGLRGFGHTAGNVAAGMRNRLQQAGFVTPFSKQYFQQLGRVIKQAPGVFAPMAGRAARSAFGGVGALFGSGGAQQLAPAATGLSKTMGKLGSAAGPVAMAAMYFKALIAPAALLGAVALLRKFTFGLSESNRDLAKWSGAIAASFAKLDIAQMRLDIQQGRATSGTAAGLNEALKDVITEFQPIREDLGILVNIIGIASARVIKTLIQGVKMLERDLPWLKEQVDALHAIEDAMKKNQPAGHPGNEVLGAIAGLPGGGVNRALPQPENFGQFMDRVRQEKRRRK